MVENDVERTEQDRSQFRAPLMAIAGGIAATLVVATLPHVYLETMIGATGLSEIMPAAAPPLGNTARGLIAVVAGLISTSALYLFLNHKPKLPGGGSDMSSPIRRNLTTDSTDEGRERKSRSPISKLGLSAKSLTRFLKKPKKSAGQVTELKDLPDIKPADRHPDAPARHPIFAASDLGAPLNEKIKPFDEPDAEEAVAEPAEEPARPMVTPEPVLADGPQDARTAEETPQARPETFFRPQKPAAPVEDLTGLTLAQLTDRLEAGIRRLEVLEGLRESDSSRRFESAPTAENSKSLTEVEEENAPVSMPPLRAVDSTAVPQDNRQADMDSALKAALGTLERMTAQR